MTDKIKDQRCLIVIPCLNEEDHLEPLIRRLAVNLDEEKNKIVIADGGSTDRTVEIAKNLEQEFSCVSYLHNPKKIQSCAVNLAVQTYGKDGYNWLLRMDAHSSYPENHLQSLLEEGLETNADSVVISLETRGQRGFQKAVAAAQNSLLGNGGSKHRFQSTKGEWVDHGHHGLIKMKAFTDIGGYDENFSHNEDAEFDLRLGKAGYKIWLTRKVSPVYFPRKTLPALARQYFRYGQGRCKTVRKHNTPLKLRQSVPLVTIPALAALLLAPLHPVFAIPALGWITACLFYGFYLGLREKSLPVFLFSGLAGMTMHASWAAGFYTQWIASWQAGLKDKA